MVDLGDTIEANSNQLNADDLIGGAKTVKITDARKGSGTDQPISLSYEGDNGKPFYPCKTMRRLLVHCWGVDGKTYIGKSMTLYRDPTVKWAGKEVGGIRISHLSDIKEKMTLALTAARGNKKPYVVQPLKQEALVIDIDAEFYKKEIRKNAMKGNVAYKAYFETLDQNIKNSIKKAVEPDFWTKCNELANLADEDINDNNGE
jgi:hypothetical protein